MKNFEFYEKEITEFFLLQGRNAACVKGWMDYLFAEHTETPVLNRAERALCEALGSGWIARDANGTLKLFTKKPHKTDDDRWKICCEQNMQVVNISILQQFNPAIQFHFIHWTDNAPWSIVDLLQLETNDVNAEKQYVIRLNIGDCVLVVERDIDPNYREVCVTLESADGQCFQDIARIGQKYHYTEDGEVVFDEQVAVKVYADALNEDYTHEFVVDVYQSQAEE